MGSGSEVVEPEHRRRLDFPGYGESLESGLDRHANSFSGGSAMRSGAGAALGLDGAGALGFRAAAHM